MQLKTVLRKSKDLRLHMIENCSTKDGRDKGKEKQKETSVERRASFRRKHQSEKEHQSEEERQ